MAELSVALIQDAIRGDRRAVRDLVDLLLPVVHYRVARALVRCRGQSRTRDLRQETEDLIQNVLLFLFNDQASALQHWRPGRGSSLTNYIGLIAERRVISILRSPWMEDPTCDDEIEEQLELEPPVDVQIGSREMLGRILEQLQERLSRRNLELFQLILVEERPVEEICTLLEMTPEAVYCARTRLARFARVLAAELAGDSVGEHIPRRA